MADVVAAESRKRTHNGKTGLVYLTKPEPTTLGAYPPGERLPQGARQVARRENQPPGAGCGTKHSGSKLSTLPSAGQITTESLRLIVPP